jgi:NAD(P)-dependent dehydrogenase (short-subunit alcohol dehydrogenase family)
MKNKIVLVTGSTDGIGKQTALELAEMGAIVLIHGKDNRKCESTLDEIKKISGNTDLKYFIADLSSFVSIRQLAREINKSFESIDVLINNAGVFANKRELNSDGIEMTFMVNHLAPFLLTNLLQEKIKRAQSARIINVSSIAHMRAKLDFDNLNSEKDFNGYAVYSLSKLANILFTYELAERLKDTSVTVNALHPGVITTKLLFQGFGIRGSSVKVGAETSVYLASSEEVKNITGKYFDKKKPVRSSKESYDKLNQKKLWEVSERVCGNFLDGA